MKVKSATPNLQRAASLVRFSHPSEGGLFDLSRVAGRLVEVSEPRFHGLLSALVELLWQVQQTGQVVSWVMTGKTIFFPPDFDSRGLDLRAIVVVSAPGMKTGLQAVEWFLQSQAYGLVVVDGISHDMEDSILGRLSKLADEASTAVIFITRKQPSDPSLGAMISLRGCVSKLSSGELESRILKDKRAGPLTVKRTRFHGPVGLY